MKVQAVAAVMDGMFLEHKHLEEMENFLHLKSLTVHLLGQYVELAVGKGVLMQRLKQVETAQLTTWMG